ncbi:uncharacterized protein [Clytia hemisphaerica]|uniref:uncharacterized protein n=1 Tax=Clytia hemisphaerica TaxID=252671 RepID=UPI0034D54329
MAELPPPSYDDVITGGQWQQDGQRNQRLEDTVPHEHSATPSAPLMCDNDHDIFHSKPRKESTTFTTPGPPAYTSASSSPHHVDNSTSTTMLGEDSTIVSNNYIPPPAPELPQFHDNDDDDLKCDTGTVTLFTLVLAVPLALLVLGAISMNKCPMSPHIPTFMVTSGAIWGAFFAFSLLALIYHQHVEDGDNNMLLVLPLLLFIAGFAVQCWGSYLVFSEWMTWRDNPHLADNLVFGCDKATYLFSFSLLIIFWCLGPCLLFLVKLAC